MIQAQAFIKELRKVTVSLHRGRLSKGEVRNEAHQADHDRAGAVRGHAVPCSTTETSFRGSSNNAIVSASDVAYLSRYLRAGGAQFADIAAVHGYLPTPIAEDIATAIDNARAVLADAGLGAVPLFVTEGSFGPGHLTDADQQAAFLTRYYLVQLGKKVDRFYWFAWDFPGRASPDAGTPVLFDHGALSSIGVAHQQIWDWVVGAQVLPCANAGTQWSCMLARGGGYQGEALWDTSQTCQSGVCSTVQVAVAAPYVKYRDLSGVSRPIDGATVPVGLKPILLERE